MYDLTAPSRVWLQLPDATASLTTHELTHSAALQTVNIAVVVLLLAAPDNVRLEAVVQALANGPLSAALIVWQSAWVFGSAAHSVRYLLPTLSPAESADAPCHWHC